MPGSDRPAKGREVWKLVLFMAAVIASPFVASAFVAAPIWKSGVRNDGAAIPAKSDAVTTTKESKRAGNIRQPQNPH